MTISHPFSRVAARLLRRFGGEAGAGVVLITVAVLAMIAANSPLNHAYHALFHSTLPWTPIAKLDTLHLWINDALMAVFFFVVGLEIKREVLDGDLSSPARRRLPVIAAIAGMVGPAIVFMAIAGNDPALRSGWAIPAATDIAFALGVLGLLGKRVPASLRLFLLSVAIVDDLGAVIIIALFYTASIKFAWLGLGAVLLAVLGACNRLKVETGWIYGLLSIALWFAVLHSGVHATIAGILAALTIPLAPAHRTGSSMLLRAEHALAPWNAYLVVPVFGLANAGVAVGSLSALLAPLPLAVAGGLVVGKQVGVLGAIAIANRFGLASPPKGASWVQLWGVSLLCGIGFTMSLFIGALAFPGRPDLYEQVKLGVMAGSLIAIIAGAAVLYWGGKAKVQPSKLP